MTDESASRRRRVPLVPQERPVPLPLSFAQERLWFLEKLRGTAGAYNMPGPLRLSGELDVAALEMSIAELIRRHESLRTRIETVDGSPIQVIAPPGSYSLELRDLSHLNEGERMLEAKRLASEDARAPFDLSRGPLFRTSLIKLADRDHVLLLTLHHIVSDGWSMGVINRELGELYDTFRKGRAPSLAPPPVQPADHAVWEREWLTGARLEEHLAYWREQLKELAPLQLPTDRPRPSDATFKGAMVQFEISESLSAGLRALTGRGTTLYMLLLAAFQVLLARYSGQDDVAVGSPVAGRTRQELDGLIGFFVNTLVMRVDLSGNPTFRQVLERVRSMALGAMAHQELPFATLVKELRPERNLAQQPLFQVMFGLLNYPMEKLEFAGLTWSYLELEHSTSIFDLSLHVLEYPQKHMLGLLEYATDLFDKSTIDRMVRHLLRLLTAIVDNPDCEIWRLPMLGEDERNQVLSAWNPPNGHYECGRCVHELFTEQVRQRSDMPAVVSGQDVLSYGEINGRANQLARHLGSLGVGPGQIVGICMDRSPEMIIGLLGILKAGGAYLPIDPNYPAERIRCMLDDALPGVVLVQDSVKGRLPAAGSQIVIWEAMAREMDLLDNSDVEPASLGMNSQSLVYVIYTSGSTGQPKGAAMTHHSMVNLVEWHRQTFGSAEGVNVLQYASLSFDVAFQEIFSTLCTGGTLFLLDEWVRRDVRALTEFMNLRSIHRLFVPPLMLQSIAEHFTSSKNAPRSLQDVIAAGEQLHISQDVVALFRHISGCRLHNNYGPTETHVVTSLTLSGDPAQWPSLPSIGRPITNVRVYILDACMQPVPAGVRGEIYIGGVAPARGYLRHPELTAQRFFPDPFGTDPASVMYKTGDIGRWRDDGTIDFLGRNDDQVKVRGYRVELSEIEVYLARHPLVKEAAVSVHESRDRGRYLVGYVTPRGTAMPAAGDLRAHMLGLVPEHMVPGAFVVMPVLPLTPSGKLDRRALPAPTPGDRASRNYEPPQGDVQQALARIWEELLEVERVGSQDNFFELGGHSLVSVKMAARVLHVLGVELSAVAVFRHPTICLLARFIESLRHTGGPGTFQELPEFEEQQV